MDVRGEKVAKRLVDQAVACYGAQALEARRGYPDVIVAPAVPGASVTGMQVAFVGNFERFRSQGGAEPQLYLGDSLTRASGCQGITWMNGFTWTVTHTPDST